MGGPQATQTPTPQPSGHVRPRLCRTCGGPAHDTRNCLNGPNSAFAARRARIEAELVDERDLLHARHERLTQFWRNPARAADRELLGSVA